MDFGLVGIEGLVGQNIGASEQEAKAKINGSGLVKQERSIPVEEDCRASKVGRAADDFVLSTTTSVHQGTPLLRSNSIVSNGGRSQMLSFSSTKPEVTFPYRDGGLEDKSAQNIALSYYHYTPSAYPRNAGYGSGSTNGSFTGIRGPFTPAQWTELEHQALIYKYFAANVAVPASLLVPIRKCLSSAGFSGYSAGFFPSHSYGWGSFHLGFSGNTDPEPGRCRRTDGKKWRCSRDAVPDQKYCERHMNRGRHRSRKPVECQTSQAASGATHAKVVPTTSSMPSSAAAGCSSSNSLANLQLQPPPPPKGMRLAACNHPPTDPIAIRLQDSQGLTAVMHPTVNLKAEDSPFSILKQDIPYEESSHQDFGLVTTDSLLDPSQNSSYLNCKNYNLFLDFNDQQTQDEHTLRHFIDEWPKDQSSRAWPEELKSDWTQLSMSIPMSSDFSSSSPSPHRGKIAMMPLRLSCELDPTQMGLGVGSVLNEAGIKQSNWVPISWGNSMGGPLAEVLNNGSGAGGAYKGTSALNLMNVGWDGGPYLGSSPTGVLQKAAFVSLPNSSSGSSPVAENKNREGASLCDDLLGSAHASSASIPSL
ncbi:hypothetical protein Nepgr_016703 [Nepenthes gracilis]|uniref:Growth-regulating factor n=1 Tax=Nepenthes gracilis TaxID=150966 RepID=A0AAD3XRJ3_NEPGR|nr:hypothetical protein Nepgr_016703 [Nepenthes gracilis]